MNNKWKHYLISAGIVTASALLVWLGGLGKEGGLGECSPIIVALVSVLGKAVHTWAQEEGVEVPNDE